MIVKLIRRLWHSPTFTSWGSIGVQIASLTLVLPLILRGFETAEIAVWYLFSTLLGLQMYFELGFSPTFQRMHAFAMGGSSKQQLATVGQQPTKKERGQPNWETIEAIYSTTRIIFFRVGGVSLILLALIGSASLYIPISACSDPSQAWAAWAVMACTTPFLVFGKAFRCYSIGTNHVALQQRWVILFGIIKTISNCAVLSLGGGILALVVSQQFWGVVNVIRDRYLARSLFDGRAKRFSDRGIDTDVFAAVWPAAWRSGTGVILSRGTLTASSLLIAQIADAPIVATYLLGINLINKVNRFALAPFYSKLPVLAKHRAANNIEKLTQLSQRGMIISYATFLSGFFVLGILGSRMTQWIGSNADFPTAQFWILIGAAFLLERIGAMHLQLYSTTNKIIWHWVTLGYSTIYCLVAVACHPFLGIYSIPLGMIAGHGLYFIPVSTWFSYKSIGSNFWNYEKRAGVPAVAIFALYALLFTPWK